MVMEHPSKMSDSVAVWLEMANPQWPHLVTQSLQLHTYSSGWVFSLSSRVFMAADGRLLLAAPSDVFVFFALDDSAAVKVAAGGCRPGHSDINRSVRVKHLPDVNRRKKEKRSTRDPVRRYDCQLRFAETRCVSWSAQFQESASTASRPTHVFFFAYIFRYAGCFPSFGTAFNTFLFPPEHLVAQLSIHKLLFSIASP